MSSYRPACPSVTLQRIPRGYLGTLKTAEQIARLIREGAKNFQVRQAAIAVLRKHTVSPKDYLGEIRAVFEWVQRNIRYTRDTVRVELLHSARRMLQLKAGDCDDFSILLGAMLEAIGHPVRMVLTGPDPRRPALFSHIYLEAYCQGHWIPLDATMPYPMGWAARARVKKVIEIDRRPKMLADDMELHGLSAVPNVPQWLRTFVQALRREAIPKQDVRVKMLWTLLQRRQLLARDPWLKALLGRCWRGLPVRERPRTTRRLVSTLRSWRILPPRAARAAGGPHNVQSVRPVALRRVTSVRPAPMRPVRALRMRPVTRGGYR